ncbi:uncharacterized protein BDR25DRAFT_352508 [Lindgomyces ingoldianus]|uniref:Uncharacterized protein n=1 Tax=Lindgomyces ingoldianus TaxID=673940 RepID=A0ACB6R3Y3_9PLEO|nr:uncharacterized protein BDR25DRAFT_352508 [Lindgomyces ingoldianus]KAF2473030.1 hypothetical protein BDR25DRAFT_352508 [Lindgomyces ingoldianus]
MATIRILISTSAITVADTSTEDIAWGAWKVVDMGTYGAVKYVHVIEEVADAGSEIDPGPGRRVCVCVLVLLPLKHSNTFQRQAKYTQLHNTLPILLCRPLWIKAECCRPMTTVVALKMVKGKLACELWYCTICMKGRAGDIHRLRCASNIFIQIDFVSILLCRVDGRVFLQGCPPSTSRLARIFSTSTNITSRIKSKQILAKILRKSPATPDFAGMASWKPWTQREEQLGFQGTVAVGSSHGLFSMYKARWFSVSSFLPSFYQLSGSLLPNSYPPIMRFTLNISHNSFPPSFSPSLSPYQHHPTMTPTLPAPHKPPFQTTTSTPPPILPSFNTTAIETDSSTVYPKTAVPHRRTMSILRCHVAKWNMVSREFVCDVQQDCHVSVYRHMNMDERECKNQLDSLLSTILRDHNLDHNHHGNQQNIHPNPKHPTYPNDEIFPSRVGTMVFAQELYWAENVPAGTFTPNFRMLGMELVMVGTCGRERNWNAHVWGETSGSWDMVRAGVGPWRFVVWGYLLNLGEVIEEREDYATITQTSTTHDNNNNLVYLSNSGIQVLRLHTEYGVPTLATTLKFQDIVYEMRVLISMESWREGWADGDGMTEGLVSG